MKNLTRIMPPDTRDREKWLVLSQLPKVDAAQQQVRHVADLLWEVAMVVPKARRAEAFAHLCLCVARDLVPFSSDTKRVGHEDIAGLTRAYTNPLEPLESPDGDDCDAKARLFVALASTHLQAKMVDWWSTQTRALQHVSAEVAINGHWVPVETILARARLGETFATVPVEPTTGKWLYP